MNQKQLAMQLSKLVSVKEKKVKLEQYPTDSEIAAEILWTAFMQGDVENKSIADFGCGNGILGIGSLLLGAKKAMLVDIDNKCINAANDNLKILKLKATLLNCDISKLQGRFDTVFQNPPFGTKQEHADKAFLIKAMESADTIYSFHKSSTEKFVNSIAEDNGFHISGKWLFKFPIKQSFEFHKKKVAYVDVGVYRLVKK
ncbi:MAG: METTL5 family protein [Nanoarchaeota archaeon]